MTYNFFTLLNGLKAVVIRDRCFPVASVSVLVRAGSLYEDKKQYGYAHLLEHLLLADTKNQTEIQIKQTVDSIGAYHNAFTRREGVIITINAVDKYLEKMMALVADEVKNPSLNPDQLKREKHVIIEEIYRARENRRREIMLQATRNLFRGHPLERDIIGSVADVRNATAGGLRRYHHQFYTARNSALIISSRQPVSVVKKIIQKHFGDWRPGVKNKFIPFHSGLPSKRYHFHSQSAKQTNLIINFLLPPPRSLKEYAAIKLLEFYLGYGSQAPLLEEIRYRRGLAYQISVDYVSYGAAGRFTIATSTSHPLETLKRIEEILPRSINNLNHKKILMETKKRFCNVFIRAHSTPLDYVGDFGSLFLTWDIKHTPKDFLRQLNNLTAADLDAAASQYLTADKRVLTIIGPQNLKRFLE